MTHQDVIIIGGGLAGCEAAWQLVRHGHRVTLHEMRPQRQSPAHKTDGLAELVCSNSLRSNSLENAAGLLKEEMRIMGSLTMEAAGLAAVPAGKALAVDRLHFSSLVEQKLSSFSGFRLVREECLEIPAARPVIIASGPLTSEALEQRISALTGSKHLYFYDAISPIIEADSIDMDRVFAASRYGAGEEDYLNCPLDRDDYAGFRESLTTAQEVPLRDFEEIRYFEGCLPIEVIARRGIDTMAFGPMKPVGLTDPRTGKQPYAVVQLRKENLSGTLYNMVGFQTKLTWPEQKRVFRMIPGLERAEFARLGSIHRNTYINSPALLDTSLRLRSDAGICFAGQITGVEGYIESAAMGILAGLSVSCSLNGKTFIPPPATTALGALLRHITKADQRYFQPMNVNFGLFEPLKERVSKKMRGHNYALRALEALKNWKSC